MNDNNLNNSDSNVGIYRATTNLNTAIENPQMNVNSVTGVNIKDLEYSSNADNNVNDNPNNLSNNKFESSVNNSLANGVVWDNSNVNQNTFNQNNVSPQSNFVVNDNANNSFIPSDNNLNVDNSYDYYQSIQNQSDVNYSYEPVMKEKKRVDDNALSNIIHSKEFKTMVFIVFVLVLFVLVMPYVYDFFRELGMRNAT